MGASGGDMAMTADAARDLGLEFAGIPDEAAARLREILTDRVTIANPFDFHTHIWFDRPACRAMFSVAQRAGFDAVGFMVDCPSALKADAASYIAVIEEFIAAYPGAPTRGAVICSLPESLAEDTRQMCLAAGIVPLQGQRQALEALDLAAAVGEAWARGGRVELRVPDRSRERHISRQRDRDALPSPSQPDDTNASPYASRPGDTYSSPSASQPDGTYASPSPSQPNDTNASASPSSPRDTNASAPPHSPRGAEGRTLAEHEGKTALAAFGVQIPKARIVTPGEAPDAAAEIGFPVVMKVASGELEHKSDVGGVVLNIRNRQDAKVAAERLAPLAGKLLVEEMVSDGVAEILIGVTVDPQFGQVLVLGAGGVLTELLRDTVSLLPPFTPSAIEAALERLATYKLLTGYRGRPRADIPALLEATMACARYAEANVDMLLELDINPVIVRPEGRGAVAVDALIRLVR
jgi:acyl-CoA synthetase (NDP forming)